MDNLKSELIAIGQHLQQLGALKLDLLKDDIQEALENPRPDSDHIEHLLDDLYDVVMWGAGRAAYEQLLCKLEEYRPEAARFYQKELEELLADEE